MTDNCGFLYKWSWTDKVPSKPVKIVKYSSPVSAFIFKGNCITCLLGRLLTLVFRRERGWGCGYGF
jgi:hypothetical protein